MYDDIRDIKFSPDGKSYAFTAKKGEKWVLVKDGKEISEYYADLSYVDVIFLKYSPD